MDNFNEIAVKSEMFDEDGNFEGFIISGKEYAQFNGLAQLLRPMPVRLAKRRQNDQNHDRVPDVRAKHTRSNDWLEEIIEFSSILARQTQATLSRIKADFQQNGMTFNTDFRNHFLSVANNRLMESFELFLIGLPMELKTNDYSIKQSETTEQSNQQNKAFNHTKSTAPAAKRRRPNNNNDNDTAESQGTVTSQSNVSQDLINLMNKFGTEISIQKKCVSKEPGHLQSIPVAVAEVSEQNVIIIEDAQIVRNMPNTEINVKPCNKQRYNTAENKSSLSKNSEPQKPSSRSLIQIPIEVLFAQTDSKTNVATNPDEQPKMDQKEKLTQTRVNAQKKSVAKSSTKEFAVKRLTIKPNVSVTKAVQNPETLKCELCPYTTNTKINLQRHSRVHAGETPFQCENCKKRFSLKIQLSKHKCI